MPKAYIVREAGYHIEDISPVSKGTNIIEKPTSFDKNSSVFHGASVHNALHIDACVLTNKSKSPDRANACRGSRLVRATGLEPARRGHQILSLARLPIPPRPHDLTIIA